MCAGVIEILRNDSRCGNRENEALRGKRMGGIVGQIESALEAELLVLGILDTDGARTHQPIELCLGNRFSFELADADEVIEL